MTRVLTLFAALLVAGCSGGGGNGSFIELDYFGEGHSTTSGVTLTLDAGESVTLAANATLHGPLTLGMASRDASWVTQAFAEIELDELEQTWGNAPLVDLDGSELTVGQTFLGKAKGYAGAGAKEHDFAMPCTFTVMSYGAPIPSAYVAAANWTTQPFLVLAYSLDDAPDQTTFDGTVSFTMQKTTYDQTADPCDHSLLGCS